eukprot:CAMPEP_0196192568 /NCGR_PEP_ID=MMETSP0911-20130528/49082_1 /TAXON_ID=49265 /ORGANISM="Thalassiosira rotula, Strain GSO102" /LENGTH=493 /DNA_ID=CAMNT_0041464761 /DNA_START=2104 /DNA_END=3585 /DNA_ORIENTATION=-
MLHQLTTTIGKEFQPSIPHLPTELGVIRLEFRRTLRETHNHGIHRARDGAHQNARQHHPRHESQSGARGADRFRIGRVVETAIETVLVEGEADGRADQADAEAEEEEDVPYEIVGDDRLPSSVLEEGEDVLPRLEVAVSVEADVDERPLVEVLEDALETAQDALGDANQYPAVVVPRRLRQGLERLEDRHEEAPEANGPERGGQRAEQASHHPRRAAGRRVVGGEPPRSHGSRHGTVHGILNHLMGEEVRQEEQKEVAVVGVVLLDHLPSHFDRLGFDHLLPDAHEGDGPEDGPPEGERDEEVGHEDDADVFLDGGARREEVDAGEGDARPDGAGVADEDGEEYHPDNATGNIPTQKTKDHHRTAQNQHHQQRDLDQQLRNAHHDGQRHPAQNDRDQSQNHRGVHVSLVIVPARRIVDGIAERLGAVNAGDGGDGHDVRVEEEGEDWIAACGGLFFAGVVRIWGRGGLLLGGGGGVVIVGGGYGSALYDYRCG